MSSDEGPAPRALGAATLVGAMQETLAQRGDQPALRTLAGDDLTWRDYGERVVAIAAGLAGVGVSRGDTIGLMLRNQPAFHLVDAAGLHLGATPFSIYNSLPPDEIAYVLRDAGARIVVTERAFLDRVRAAAESLPGVEHVVVVDGAERNALSLGELEARAAPGFDFARAWQAVRPTDLATLIYTSGTTGPPKGVEITHGNVLAAVRGFHKVVGFPATGELVSWLPMAHAAERICTHYVPMTHGYGVTCCADPSELFAHIQQVRPVWFFAVPRIWEKLKAVVEAGIEGDEDRRRSRLTREAVEVGLEVVRRRQAGQDVPPELLAKHRDCDTRVLRPIRERLGLDQAKALNVGAAPTPPAAIEFFHALGLPLAEVWGLSETCAAGACNPSGRIKIGTVGPPLPGVELKLGADGEVLVRSEAIMAGYRNMPDKTAETIDDEGWLATGDIGELDADGYLKIVDRKKELIINAAGKNMSPANIEAKLKAASPLIGQAMAIGDQRPYNVALVVLDPDFAPMWAKQNGLESESLELLAREDKLIEAVQAGVDAANAKMSRVEQIKRFTILPSDWVPGGDELTPTMKLKRKPISEKYAREIDELYRDQAI